MPGWPPGAGRCRSPHPRRHCDHVAGARPVAGRTHTKQGAGPGELAMYRAARSQACGTPRSLGTSRYRVGLVSAAQPVPSRRARHGTGHVQVRDVEFAAVTVVSRFPVLPQVGEDTRYEPLGRRKVATPASSVGDERLVLAEVTLTTAFAAGCFGVPPLGRFGPPAWITVTMSVPVFPP
jgi:hypothetical protein